MDKSFFKLPDKVFGINISFLKLFVVPFLVLVGFIISFNLVIRPRFASLAEVNKSISNVNEQISLTTQKINYLTTVDQEQIKNDVSFLESAVLQEKNSYFLVGIIRNVADQYDFVINSFSISSIELKDNNTLKVADKDVAVKLPLEVSLSGPSEKRVELMTALENTLPILFIDNLNISNAGNFSTLDMTISSYYIAEKSDLVLGNLSLADLIPTEEENGLLKTISSFNKITGEGLSLSIGETGLFVKYERDNPFSL